MNHMSNYNITGIYRFYENGNMIYEQKNALTDLGRATAIKALIGVIPQFASELSYGIGDTANTVSGSFITNNALDYEVGRTNVIGSTLTKIAGTNREAIVFSGTINDVKSFSLREIGLYPPLAGINELYTGKEIIAFDDNITLTGLGGSGTYITDSNIRIGSNGWSLPTSNGTSSYVELNAQSGIANFLSGYSVNDTFAFAFYNPSVSNVTLTTRLFTDTSNYYTLTFSTTGSGYKIATATKGSATITGSPIWNNITAIRIWQSAANNIFLDGMRINDTDGSDTNYGLLSRAVLATPVTKSEAIPLDIQYVLSVGFNIT